MKHGSCVEGCGACCHPLVSPVSPMQIAMAPAWDTELVWMRDNTERMPQSEAIRLDRSHRDDRPVTGMVDGEAAPVFFYRCRNYDEATKACTAYDDRPPMCRDYPWYGRLPDPTKAIPNTCGYLRDVGIVPVAITPKAER